MARAVVAAMPRRVPCQPAWARPTARGCVHTNSIGTQSAKRNISVRPGFSPSTLAWLEAGGIYAQANMRGGSEYGQTWHEAGMLDKKQNVFDDYIAAAEWLIANKYTRPGKLAIRGGSNGGLLVAACMLQRPDLYGAVILTTPQEVSVEDARRSVSFARALEVPVLGIVENMSGVSCPHCNESFDLFKTGGGQAIAADLDVPFLGAVPLDPELVRAADEGRLDSLVDSPAMQALEGIAGRIAALPDRG